MFSLYVCSHFTLPTRCWSASKRSRQTSYLGSVLHRNDRKEISMETIWTDSNSVRLMPTTFLRHNCSDKQMRRTGVHASLVPVASVEECATKCQPITALDRTETLRRNKVRYRIPADPRRGHIRNMATYVRWMGFRSNH